MRSARQPHEADLRKDAASSLSRNNEALTHFSAWMWLCTYSCHFKILLLEGLLLIS